MGDLLKLQEQTKEKRVGGSLLTPRLPQMQGHRATTSFWPALPLRGAGAPRQTLIADQQRGSGGLYVVLLGVARKKSVT
jgi:hypothetical protein